MKNKKSPHLKDAGNKQDLHNKDKKKYLLNMPKKLGLPSGKKYYFNETAKGYRLSLGHGLWIGMPKMLVENNPHLYTLTRKGGFHGSN